MIAWASDKRGVDQVARPPTSERRFNRAHPGVGPAASRVSTSPRGSSPLAPVAVHHREVVAHLCASCQVASASRSADEDRVPALTLLADHVASTWPQVCGEADLQRRDGPDIGNGVAFDGASDGLAVNSGQPSGRAQAQASLGQRVREIAGERLTVGRGDRSLDATVRPLALGHVGVRWPLPATSRRHLASLELPVRCASTPDVTRPVHPTIANRWRTHAPHVRVAHVCATLITRRLPGSRGAGRDAFRDPPTRVAPPGSPQRPPRFRWPVPRRPRDYRSRARRGAASLLGLADLHDELGAVVRRGDVLLDEAVAAALTVWHHEFKTGDLSPESLEKFNLLIARFSHHANLLGATTLVDAEAHVYAFVGSLGRDRTGAVSKVSTGTQHLRRSTLRRFWRTCRQLGLPESDPTLDLQLPPRTGQSARPLDPDELDEIKDFADAYFGDTREPAAIALGLGGASTGETGYVRVGDTSVDADATGGSILIWGSDRHTPRRAELDGWQARRIHARREALRARADSKRAWLAMPLIYEGTSEAGSRQSSTCVALRNAIVRAGLGGEPDIKPKSLALGAALLRYNASGQIQDAAAFLGMRSLDPPHRPLASTGRPTPSHPRTCRDRPTSTERGPNIDRRDGHRASPRRRVRPPASDRRRLHRAAPTPGRRSDPRHTGRARRAEEAEEAIPNRRNHAHRRPVARLRSRRPCVLRTV